MEIKIIDRDFSICKVKNYSDVDITDSYVFIAKTDKENSLVCETDKVPNNTTHIDNGWKAFRIEGILDFSLIGILSKISTLLAENKIGIFAISTFNTDYILTKKENFQKAISILSKNGYKIIK